MSEMKPYQAKAWNCLTETEQNALFLNLAEGRSTWEMSESMSITHYKILEIKARAEYLFKRFSDYYSVHPSLVSPQSPIRDLMRDYFEACLEKRMSRKDAMYYAGEGQFRLRKVQDHNISSAMRLLSESEDSWDRDLYSLVIDFDRWSPFRILPVEYQAPSPYRRRMIRKWKRYLQFLYTIPDFKVNEIVRKYSQKREKKGYWFAAMISMSFLNGFKIIRVARIDKNLSELTKMNLYLFDTEEKAEVFGLHASRFYEYSTDPKLSRAFWTNYEGCVQEAINYKEVNHLDFHLYPMEQSLGLKRDPQTAPRRKNRKKIAYLK